MTAAAPPRTVGAQAWIAVLLANDRRTLAREPLLLLMLLGPALLVALARFGTPPVSSLLAAQGLDVATHHALVAGFLVAMLIPYLLGALLGLTLLDERDGGILLALKVSPLGLGRYLGYRLGLVGCLSATAVLVGLPLSGLVTVTPVALVMAAGLAGLVSAVIALLLAAFGSNKVEGLATMKAASLPLLTPALAWFLDAPERWTLAIVPTAWPSLVLWDMTNGWLPVVALAGSAYLCLWARWLARRVTRRVVA